MTFLRDYAITNALLAAALGGLVAAVCPLVRRPALSHGLWLLVVIKLLVPPMVFLTIALPWWSTSAPSSVETSGSAALASGVGWTLLVLWLAGSIVMGTISAWRIVQFRRVLALASPAPQRLMRKVELMAQRMGLAHVPEVWFLPGSLPPLVWSMAIVPRIYLPLDLFSKLPPQQRGTLLVHELAHLLRGDHLIRWIELAATVCFWWHPIVWFAHRALRQAEEQCCDAWVVESYPDASREYADAILETLDFLADDAPAPALGAVGVTQVGDLAARLVLVMEGTGGRVLSRLDWWSLAAAAAVSLPFGLRF